MPFHKAANILAVDMEDNIYKAMSLQLVDEHIHFCPFLLLHIPADLVS